MQVSVEKISNVERRLTIVVPVNQLEEAYEKQIAQFAKKANIKGFRPGKAPLKVIQQRFGDEARKEALGEVIQKSLYEAITEQKFRPISMPRVEPKRLTEGQPLEFVAIIEIMPEIEKVNFDMKGIEKLDVTVSDADLDRVIDQLRKQYTKWNLVDRTAKENDRVVVNYYAVFEGHSDEANKIQHAPVEIGSKRMLPGFEEGLIGTKAGDQKTLQLTFPDNVGASERAGKPVDFVVEIKQVFEADMPAMDEAFVNQLGVKSGQLNELKQQVKQSLEQERDRLVKERVKEQLFSLLLEQNPIEVPKSMVEREAATIHDEMYPKHQHHDHHQHSPEEMSTFNDIAQKRVALSLLITEFANKHDLKPDEAKVKQRIEEIASVYEHPQEVVVWLSSDEQRRHGIEAQVREDQVMDKLLEGVPVTIKPMSYAELKGIRI